MERFNEYIKLGTEIVAAKLSSQFAVLHSIYSDAREAAGNKNIVNDARGWGHERKKKKEEQKKKQWANSNIASGRRDRETSNRDYDYLIIIMIAFYKQIVISI